MQIKNDEYLDFTTNDIFFSPSGAQFCPKTGFVFLPFEDQKQEKVLKSAEFNHETFHYLSSMMTSAGFFLSCLRYTRARDIRSAILNYEPDQDRPRSFDSLDVRKIYRLRKTEIKSIMDVENDNIPPIIHNITKSRLGEMAFMHMSQIIDELTEANLHPSGVILEAQLHAAKGICHK